MPNDLIAQLQALLSGSNQPMPGQGVTQGRPPIGTDMRPQVLQQMLQGRKTPNAFDPGQNRNQPEPILGNPSNAASGNNSLLERDNTEQELQGVQDVINQRENPDEADTGITITGDPEKDLESLLANPTDSNIEAFVQEHGDDALPDELRDPEMLGGEVNTTVPSVRTPRTIR